MRNFAALRREFPLLQHREFWGISWICGVPWLALISIAYFVWRPRRERLGGNPLDLARNPAED
jgi:hypothetical protein